MRFVQYPYRNALESTLEFSASSVQYLISSRPFIWSHLSSSFTLSVCVYLFFISLIFIIFSTCASLFPILQSIGASLSFSYWMLHVSLFIFYLLWWHDNPSAELTHCVGCSGWFKKAAALPKCTVKSLDFFQEFFFLFFNVTLPLHFFLITRWGLQYSICRDQRSLFAHAWQPSSEARTEKTKTPTNQF